MVVQAIIANNSSSNIEVAAIKHPAIAIMKDFI